MNDMAMTLMVHTENALIHSGETREVLKMWLSSVSGENEALKVGAVISLLDNSIKELTQAREYFTTHSTDGSGEDEK
ncbi:hypothetical protein MLB55_001379 [Salmonella enterica]|uniref:Uncharacterized protein n=2 Tax=Salmonella enterica I TaxID=59201 RepID=A0A5X8XST4_SALNE|nr:hypothetical protein [Salmonella enterica]EBR7993970.1 hypothetical protein [Salmonella enterica subsp. enterica serovar Panama]EBV0461880.1 hypothetical protein [Salmonella enterica subsp. enterica serovar Newport]ASD84878.1 hypothetical protein LFZ16_00630 [Salmonella enterica subsp. enterica serovar India str. SA20085604]EAW2934207.1 hypothetical protein [Salmonella enterica]EBR8434524.1 hypothetical protein [Salmonella enterica subsp. enterica serovar Panama]